MENKSDLRIRRTYRLLSEALIELMKQKSFEKITVMEICSQAMVHRATFYKYFEDKSQLLDYCMQDLSLAFDKGIESISSFDDYKEYFLNAARGILGEFDAHRDAYITILKRNSKYYLANKIQETLTYKLYAMFEEGRNAGLDIPAPSDILAHVYAGVCISVLFWWIKSGNGVRIDDVIGYMGKIIGK